MASGKLWIALSAICLAGISAAFQVGKAPIALPEIRAALAADLVAAGWVIGGFSAVAAGAGLLAGFVVDRLGYRATIVGGLLLMAVAGAAGALVDSIGALIATRLLEGVGFLLVVTSGPRFIVALMPTVSQRFALGLWSTYMPLGVALMMVGGPWLLAPWGWRGLWWLNVALVLLAGLLVLAATPALARGGAPALRFGQALSVLRAPGPLLLAACFATFTFQHLAVIGFLPTLLVEQSGLAVGMVGLAAALVVVVNAVGGLSAGILLERDVGRSRLIGVAGAILALAALGLADPGLPGGVRYLCALVISGVGGLIPGAVMAGIPQHAPSPAHIGSVSGLLVQGSQVGQFPGPATVSGLVVATGGWQAAGWALAAAACLTVALALALGRLEARPEREIFQR